MLLLGLVVVGCTSTPFSPAPPCPETQSPRLVQATGGWVVQNLSARQVIPRGAFFYILDQNNFAMAIAFVTETAQPSPGHDLMARVNILCQEPSAQLNGAAAVEIQTDREVRTGPCWAHYTGKSDAENFRILELDIGAGDGVKVEDQYTVLGRGIIQGRRLAFWENLGQCKVIRADPTTSLCQYDKIGTSEGYQPLAPQMTEPEWRTGSFVYRTPKDNTR